MIKDIVIKAYNLAKEKHERQFRKYSEIPYITHPKYVARLVEKLTNNEILVAAALLHDIIEDTDITIDEIRNKFGYKIASIVDELTNKKEERLHMKKRDYMYWKFRNISTDALLIKLADRLHNIIFLDKDCNSKEEIDFIKYYIRNTKYIINNLSEDIKNKSTKCTWMFKHQLLLNLIESNLSYLGYIYKVW